MEPTPQQKGRESELNVASALDELKAEGLIAGYRRTKKYSADDRRGIDFFIFIEHGRVPLQVKSCNWHRKLFVYHNQIPCIVGQGPGLKSHLLHIIQRYFNDPAQ